MYYWKCSTKSYKSCKETKKCDHTLGKKADNRNCLWGGPNIGLRLELEIMNMFQNYIIVNKFKGKYDYSDASNRDYQ